MVREAGSVEVHGTYWVQHIQGALQDTGRIIRSGGFLVNVVFNLSSALWALGANPNDVPGGEYARYTYRAAAPHVLRILDRIDGQRRPLQPLVQQVKAVRPQVQVAWDLVADRPVLTHHLGVRLRTARQFHLNWTVPLERAVAERITPDIADQVSQILGIQPTT